MQELEKEESVMQVQMLRCFLDDFEEAATTSGQNSR
jgi:hypothetical protein